MKCSKETVAGRYFRLRICDKTAKWLVNNKLRCGIHALPSNPLVKKYGRVPIKEAAK